MNPKKFVRKLIIEIPKVLYLFIKQILIKDEISKEKKYSKLKKLKAKCLKFIIFNILSDESFYRFSSDFIVFSLLSRNKGKTNITKTYISHELISKSKKLKINYSDRNYSGWNESIRKIRSIKGNDLFSCFPPIINNGNGTAIICVPAGAGFYSAMLNAMICAYICTIKGLLPHFVWKNYLYEDPSKSNNTWDVYFKQPTTLPVLSEHEYECGMILRDEKISNKFDLAKDEKDMFLKSKCVNKDINKQIIDHFYTNLMLPEVREFASGFPTEGHVGVHIRALPKKNNHDRLKRDTSDYIMKIHEALKHPFSTSGKIFLATDSKKNVELMEKAFPGLVVTNHALRSDEGKEEIHLNKYYAHISGYQKGLEVIRDVDMLSRCPVFVNTLSYIKYFVERMNPHQHSLIVYNKAYEKFYGE